MIFNKKRSFIYISILLLILIVGVYFVSAIGSITRATSFVKTYSAVAQTNGKNYTEISNWTRGGVGERFNFTIVLNPTTGYNGTPNFNISLPSTALYGSGSGSFAFPDAAARIEALITENSTNVNWTIVNSSSIISFRIVQGNTSPGATYFMWFNATAPQGEGVYNWTVATSNATLNVADSGFGVLTGVDGLPPRVSGHNITEGSTLITSFSGTKYLKYDPSTGTNIVINLTVTDYNADRVLLIFNSTGGSLNLTAIRNNLDNNITNRQLINSGDGSGTSSNNSINGVITEVGSSGNKANLTSLISRSDVTLASAPGYLFSFNISNFTWSAADGTTFKYVFVVYDLYNQSEIINNSNTNLEFVLARDSASPTATLTAPSDTSISLYDSISYTCNGADTSGLASCTTTLTKPGSSTADQTLTGCGTEQTFTSTYTNTPGDYTVGCAIVDNVGRTSSTSSTFSVSAATGGGSSSSGSSGGRSGGSSMENPVTVGEGVTTEIGTLSTTDTYTSIAESGTVSFTVADGSHTAKVLTVTDTSVTIEFSSTPQDITLNIGESKDVDLNSDGNNDVMVTLSSITYGKADLVFKMIEAAVPTPEPTPSPTTPGEVTGQQAGSNLTWLWIVIVVVVILLIWYFSRKKQ